jgi:hypothetical protein
MISKYKYILAPLLLLVICLFINTAFFIKYRHYPLSPDSIVYKNIALAIINPSATSLNGDIFVNITPGYPAFIAIIYKVFGQDDSYVYLFQIILSLLSVLLFFKIMLSVTKENYLISFFITFFFTIYYPVWAFSILIMMEIITIFVLLISIYFFQKYCDDKLNKYLYLFIILFSILIFINNRFIFHFSFILVFLFFILRKKPGGIIVLSKAVLCFILILSPWFVREYTIYKQPVLFTPFWNNAAYNLFSFPPRINVETSLENEIKYFKGLPVTFEYYKQEIKNARGPSYAEGFKIDDYKRLISRYNPQNKLGVYFYRLRWFFIPISFHYEILGSTDKRLVLPSNINKLITGLLNLIPILILSLIGVFFAFKNNNIFARFLSFLFISHIVLHVYINFVDRYRHTILPVIYLLAGYGLMELLKYLSQYSKLSFIKKII